MMYAKSKAALARALDRSRPSLYRWLEDPTFPARGPDGWDVAACRLWLEGHVRTRKPVPSSRAAPEQRSADTGQPPPIDLPLWVRALAREVALQVLLGCLPRGLSEQQALAQIARVDEDIALVLRGAAGAVDDYFGELAGEDFPTLAAETIATTVAEARDRAA